MIIIKFKNLFLLCLVLLVFCVPAFPSQHTFFFAQNGDYTAPAASGSADPSDITDLEIWIDATDVYSGAEPTADDDIGGSGEEWQDLSTNGRDMEQTTPANRPLYKTNILNSKPGILFDGSDDYITASGSPNLAQPITVYVVFTCTDATQGDIILGGSYIWAAGFASKKYQLSFGSAVLSSANAFDNSALMTRFLINNPSDSEIDNRLVTDTGLNAGTGNLTGIIFSNDGTPFVGYLHELIVYTRDLSAQEISDTETYLKAKWGSGI